MIAAIETLIPVFAIILLGAGLKRIGMLSEEQWRGVEDLIYYICFPALIIATLARTVFSTVPVLALAAAMAASVLTMSAILYLARAPLSRWLKANPPAYTSIFQGATRWNTYVALAVVGSLYGADGISLAAIGIAVMIPLLNVLCVSFLLAHVRDEAPSPAAIARGLYTNPLIIACVIGIAINASGLPVYAPILETGAILGRATLGLGLLCVGAGLRIEDGLHIGPRVAFTSIARLIGMPLLMALFCLAFGVSGMAFAVAIICAAVPTASFSYVLARKLGGDAPLMARIITVETLAAAITLPVIIALLPAT
ncbi:AEC family transporter [Tepidamorphus sp. 3E244]|uniref:AEC family transporter n=1 Tax=Tepidamorphus sp. 3E244 TaxID=3385498 RepID=UPI0038FBF776